MDIVKLIQQAKKPQLYAQGTDTMWTDPHISRHLLAAHLDPNIEAASRPPNAVEAVVDLISNLVQPGAKILDLGCGPGLYAQRLAEKGYAVTGIDFSATATAYAKAQRDQAGLAICYREGNYLELDWGSGFDLIIMIYCDFGALVPVQRRQLLTSCARALGPGGIFLFDAIDDTTPARLEFGTSWEALEQGFFSPHPHLCLRQSFHYPEQKAVLEQHLVLQQDGSVRMYRFWNHYFDKDDLRQLLRPYGFAHLRAFFGLLQGSSPYNDHGVVFYAAWA